MKEEKTVQLCRDTGTDLYPGICTYCANASTTESIDIRQAQVQVVTYVPQVLLKQCIQCDFSWPTFTELSVDQQGTLLVPTYTSTGTVYV